MADKKVVVPCRCPRCGRLYRQKVWKNCEMTGALPRQRYPALIQLIKSCDRLPGRVGRYYRIFCAECCRDLAPPILKKAVFEWSKQGEIL